MFKLFGLFSVTDFDVACIEKTLASNKSDSTESDRSEDESGQEGQPQGQGHKIKSELIKRRRSCVQSNSVYIQW